MSAVPRFAFKPCLSMSSCLSSCRKFQCHEDEQRVFGETAYLRRKSFIISSKVFLMLLKIKLSDGWWADDRTPATDLTTFDHNPICLEESYVEPQMYKTCCESIHYAWIDNNTTSLLWVEYDRTSCSLFVPPYNVKD